MAGNMYIEVSDACMFHCITCPKGQNAYSPREGYITTEQVLSQLIEMQKLYQIDSVTLSGGEPLLNPNIFEIIEKIDQRGIRITMLTNLFFLSSREMAVQLKQASERLSVVVAIHSDDPAEHDRITGVPGSLEHAVKGVSFLLEAGVKVILKVILSDQTCEKLQDIFRFATNLWGKRMQFNLCGLDLCGIPDKNRDQFPLDFKHQAELNDLFLTEAEQYYGDELDHYIAISEYPLCCVDPYYWKLVHRNQTQLTSYIADKQMHTTEKLRPESTCAPHARACFKCLVSSICPGMWYSIYETYGETMAIPYLEED